MVTTARADDLPPLELVERSVCALYEKAREAVVKVHAEQEFEFIPGSAASSHRVGTGFFINHQGVLLTAATVVREADRCWIDWRERRLPAQVIGACDRVNLAVLRVDAPTPALAWGDSEALRVGSVVVAIGFPYEFPSAPVLGAINGFDIRRGGHVFATSHLRTSCRLRPGQGGGPLLNAQGEVVGMAVAAHHDEESYALPARAARRVVEDLLAHGRPRLGWVGLDVTERPAPRPADGAQDVEVVVRAVLPGSPAAAAGFLAGDRLLAVGAHPIDQLAVVLDEMFLHRAGDVVSFEVLRTNRAETLLLTVGTRPPDEDAGQPGAGLPMIVNRPGLSLTPVGHER